MALKPLKPCRKPGCPELTREGWCPKHKPKDAHRSQEARAWRRWYSLDIWTKDLRPAQLMQEPFCRECARRYPPDDPRHRTPATDVDHVKDHRGEWNLFVDRDNLQSLCHRCHSQKTMREMNKKRRNF